MPGDGEPTTTTASLYGGGERGAGGKTRRERKPPSTPYDRPQPPRRWISRLVDPAKRLISGGATLLLPSLFAPNPNPDDIQTQVEHETLGRNPNTSLDTPTEGFYLNDAKGKSKLENGHEDGEDNSKDHSDVGQPDIEQLINGKTFSRDEFDRLLEIMSSRVVDVEQERKPSSMTGAKEFESAETSHEKHPSSLVGAKDVDRAQTSQERQKTPIFEGQTSDRFRLATSTPLQLATMQDGIGASPVDIAKAYMGSRPSGMGFTSTSPTWKNEKLGLASENSSKPFIPSPRPKTAVCWPGAITENQQQYSTPQTQKSRFGIHSFPRTPYSRTMYTRSKSKLTPLPGDSERLVNVSSTPLQQIETSYQKSMSTAVQGSYGSGGPIRRTRNKFTSTTTARESALTHSVQRSPFSKELSGGMALKRSYEPGSSSTSKFEPLNSKAASFETGVSSVHPHSTKLARQILEQIDRPVTLKERSKELKLASPFKNLRDAAQARPVQNINSHGETGVGISKSINVNGSIINELGKSGLNKQKTDFVEFNAEKEVADGFVAKLDKSGASSGSDKLSQAFQITDSRTRSPEQAMDSILPKRSFFAVDQSKVLDSASYSARSEQQSSPRKPSLPSIAVNKPGLRNSFSSDIGAGFTFPVTTSASTYSDLPTPTVMPTLAGSPPRSDGSANLPTAAGKITIAPPVFSFPFTGAASDSVAPKFKFGSGNARLSFALEVSDAAYSPDDGPSITYKFESGKSRLNFGSVVSNAVSC